MESITLPNCWDDNVRETTARSFTLAARNWCSQWFVNSTADIEWFWNDRLFACAGKIQTPAYQTEAIWLAAATKALAITSLADADVNIVTTIAQQMEQELYQVAGWPRPDDSAQLAAIIHLTVAGETLVICLQAKVLQQEYPAKGNRFSQKSLETISDAQSIVLSCQIISEPISVKKVLSLKVGDKILMQHMCNIPFKLTHSEQAVADAFLVDYEQQRALVIVRGNE